MTNSKMKLRDVVAYSRYIGLGCMADYFNDMLKEAKDTNATVDTIVVSNMFSFPINKEGDRDYRFFNELECHVPQYFEIQKSAL